MLVDLGWKQKLEAVDEKIERNADFLRQVVDSPEIFSNHEYGEGGDEYDNDVEFTGEEGDVGGVADPHAPGMASSPFVQLNALVRWGLRDL